MRRNFSKIFVVSLLLALSAGCAARQNRGHAPPNGVADEELNRIRTAVEGSLTAPPPRGYEPIPRGVRLLSIARGVNRIVVMDFSNELIAGGGGKVLEDALHQIMTAASNARRDTPDRVDDYRILIKGVPLDAYRR